MENEVQKLRAEVEALKLVVRKLFEQHSQGERQFIAQQAGLASLPFIAPDAALSGEQAGLLVATLTDLTAV